MRLNSVSFFVIMCDVHNYYAIYAGRVIMFVTLLGRQICPKYI